MRGALIPDPELTYLVGVTTELSGIAKTVAEAAGLDGQVIVRCRHCGAEGVVDGAKAFLSGWPKHCGATMSIDPLSADMRARQAMADTHPHSPGGSDQAHALPDETSGAGPGEARAGAAGAPVASL